MNPALSFALAAVFFSVGTLFIARARQDGVDVVAARNSTLAGWLMLFAGTAFAVTGAVAMRSAA